MRIAIIGKKHPFYGIVTYCRELVSTLKAQGHTVAFFYMHDGPTGASGEAALPYRLRTHMYVLDRNATRERLQAELAAFRPDVVHGMYAISTLDFALPEICRAIGVPLVVTFHPAFDSRPSLPNRVSALVYRAYARTLGRCDRVIVFSSRQRDKLTELGVSADRVAIVPNGVDPERYRPGPSRFRSRLGAESLLTYMGRLDPEKNVGALLEVFTMLDRDGAHLAIVGDGVLGARLRRRFAAHPRVHFLGAVAEEAARIDVLRGSDMFVLPSSVEGLSLSLLEAMACGAAPVATDAGADGEVIDGCGWVLDPLHVHHELRSALTSLLDDAETVRRWSGLARRRVLERYDARGNGRLLERLYATAVRDQGSGIRDRVAES